MLIETGYIHVDIENELAYGIWHVLFSKYVPAGFF